MRLESGEKSAPAVRVVSLLASATEILYALGLGNNVVAVSHECDFPAECTTKPRVTRAKINAIAASGAIDAEVRALLATGESLYAIDADLLASLRPDIIVTQAHCEVCAVSDRDVHAVLRDRAELLGVRVVSLNPTTLEAVFEDIQRIGDATQLAENAAKYRAILQSRIDAVASRLAHVPVSARPTVACIEWIEPLMVAANWMPDLITRAGGRAVITKSGERSRETSWTALREAKPDVIIVSPCGFDLARTLEELPTLQSHPLWCELRAVQNGNVFAADGNAYFNRSGPRLVDTIELIAQLIFPAIFARTNDSGVVRRIEP